MYQIEQLPNEPILVLTVDHGFSLGRELDSVLDDLKEHLDAATEPVFDITVAKQIDVSFTDLVMAMASVTRGNMAVLRHPMFREAVIVSDHQLAKLGASALRQVQYGNSATAFFETLDDALAYARQKIAATRSANERKSA